MSLYHEAAQVLEKATRDGGSIKLLVFGKKDWKSDPKTLYALTTEAAKWSEILSEAIDHSGFLTNEKQLTPILTLLLAHDLLLSRKGIALPSKHGLHTAIARHKARLAAELTKARLRRGCTSVDALRALVNEGSSRPRGTESPSLHPRWVRINTLRTTLEEQLSTSLAGFEQTRSLANVIQASPNSRFIYQDEHIPDLVAVPANCDLTKTAAYGKGMFILQDKASCFPAYLLNPRSAPGDIIDACAAPGNKTTHLAALVAPLASETNEVNPSKILACEKDRARSSTLSNMVKLAGADRTVSFRANQDFLKLDPQAREFANVTCLLLDPSCSGSGIIGRDEVTVTIHLPTTNNTASAAPRGKKRKHHHGNNAEAKQTTPLVSNVEQAEETTKVPEYDEHKLQARLKALSEFQLRLLKHAMSFPAAQRITYSTCSIYEEENEDVIVQALLSDIAFRRGWRVITRHEQVSGLRNWPRRGNLSAFQRSMDKEQEETSLTDLGTIADACIRCIKSGEEGTMGFFVAGFVKDRTPDGSGTVGPESDTMNGAKEEYDESEWFGFSDDEG